MPQHIDASKNNNAFVVSQHFDANKNTKAWAVSQHIDANKNTKAWAVSQHIDASKIKTKQNNNKKLGYALHIYSYAGTIFSHDVLLV